MKAFTLFRVEKNLSASQGVIGTAIITFNKYTVPERVSAKLLSIRSWTSETAPQQCQNSGLL